MSKLLLLAPLSFIFAYGQAQSVLSRKQIDDAEALGRRTRLPLSLGTLVHGDVGGGFVAFITLPEQRVAYAKSDQVSDRGSNSPDPLQSELRLNRLRVTGVPYPSSGAGQHNSRQITLCEQTGKQCVSPSHQVLDANQAVAEFDMASVIKISAPKGVFLLRIVNDLGKLEPEELVTLAQLRNIHPH